jgi:tRNA(Ile)-lysidine synthase
MSARSPGVPARRRRATARVDAALRSSCATLREKGFAAGSRVLVGVSGGQDSLCLLHALWRLQSEHEWALHVVHVDHGLRPSAAAEADQVAAVCVAWGLPVEIARVDVPAYRRRARLNLQEAARYARYQAFGHIAQRLNAAAVLVGHTADDVAETFLLHLLRGAGLDGLAALPLLRSLPTAALGPPLDARALPAALDVGRPLRTVARRDTAAYCAEHGLLPVAETPGPYRRDRIRHDLLPYLEGYNPRARAVLARAAFALAEERMALLAYVDSAWAGLARRQDRAIVLPVGGWSHLPAAIQKRVLLRATADLAGSEVELSARLLSAAVRLARSQSGRAIDLPGGLRLEREPRQLRLAPREAAPPGNTGPWPLPVPGAIALPGIGTVRVERRSAPPASFPAADAPECWLDGARLCQPLAVRLRRPGDQIQPFGLKRPKRLQDLLVDAGVPRRERARLPLVVCGDQIAWVVGVRIAHWARVRPESRALVHITFERADSLGVSTAGAGASTTGAASGVPPGETRS